MSANVFVTKDYENKTALRLQKNKPKTNPISNTHKPIKGARKKGYQELFLALNFWKGYNIVLSKRKFPLVLGVYCDE